MTRLLPSIACGLALAACGGGHSDPAPAPTPSPSPTSTATATPAACAPQGTSWRTTDTATGAITGLCQSALQLQPTTQSDVRILSSPGFAWEERDTATPSDPPTTLNGTLDTGTCTGTFAGTVQQSVGGVTLTMSITRTVRFDAAALTGTGAFSVTGPAGTAGVPCSFAFTTTGATR